MLIDICIKFHEYSLSGFQVIERTRFVTDRQTDRQTGGRPGKNNMSPDLKGGRRNDCILILMSFDIYTPVLLNLLTSLRKSNKMLSL